MEETMSTQYPDFPDPEGTGCRDGSCGAQDQYRTPQLHSADELNKKPGTEDIRRGRAVIAFLLLVLVALLSGLFAFHWGS